MTPTESGSSEHSTTPGPVSDKVARQADLIPSIPERADTSVEQESNSPLVPSSVEEGNVWLRCRVRHMRLGRGEGSTQG